MLNCTLSANLNGLNLGTRSLATLAGLNIGTVSRSRMTHPHMPCQFLRDGDSKSMGDLSIKVGGSSQIPQPPFSPQALYSWQFTTSASVASVEVVVPTVAVPVPALRAGRPAEAARLRVLSESRASEFLRTETTTRCRPAPVACTAAGG